MAASGDMTPLEFALAFALVLRLTRLITTDSITEPLRAKLHQAVSPQLFGTYDQVSKKMLTTPWSPKTRVLDFIRRLTDCDWCVSLWLAAAITPIAWHYADTPAFQGIAIAAAFSYLVGFTTTATEALERHDAPRD